VSTSATARAPFLRLSGTGTEGATLRVYLERSKRIRRSNKQDSQAALAGVVAAVENWQACAAGRAALRRM